MSTEESARQSAVNKPANHPQETATHAQRQRKHSDGDHRPLPFDDDDTNNTGEASQSDDPQKDPIE